MIEIAWRSEARARLEARRLAMPSQRSRVEIPDPDFDDIEGGNGCALLVERIDRRRVAPNQGQLQTVPHRRVSPWQDGEEITVPRRQAKPGEICNPWLDHGNFFPLLNSIAGAGNLTATDKLFHAVLFRRVLLYGGRLPPDKLAAEAHVKRRVMCDRIRRFLELGLLGRSRFKKEEKKLVLLRYPTNRPYDQAALDKIQQEEHSSRIPCEMILKLAVQGQRRKIGDDDLELTPQEIVTYARLCGLAGREGWWYGSHEKLAEACGCEAQALRRALGGLEKKRLILIDHHKKRVDHQRGGGWNIYRFLGHELFRGDVGGEVSS